MMSFRILLAFALAFLPLAEAAAGTSTITTKDASGATKTFVVTTDGSGNFVAQSTLCDQAAAAQCATVTAGNALKVDGSAVTQPVSGTVTANAGTGNFTVTQGTASNLNATVVGTGTFATQAAQSGTWTVQPGNTANTTAWLVTGTGGTFPATQSGTWTVQPGNTANTAPWLASISQGGNTATVAAAGADGLTNSTLGLNTYANLRIFNGTTWDRLIGDTTNGVWVNVKNSTTAIRNDQDGVSAVSSASNSPTIGYNYVWNGSTWDRMAGTTGGVKVIGALATSGGWTKKRLSALSTTVTAVKSSAAGQLGMLHCANPNSSDAFVQIFDVATAGGVTLGTTAPDLSFRVPANNATGFALALTGAGFGNGIQTAATTTATGSSAPSTALDCNALYN